MADFQSLKYAFREVSTEGHPETPMLSSEIAADVASMLRVHDL